LKSLFIITIIFYGCNSNLLCYHGVVERNCISSLHSHGKAISLLFIIILLIYFYLYFLFKKNIYYLQISPLPDGIV